jgi:hypothetical protein
MPTRFHPQLFCGSSTIMGPDSPGPPAPPADVADAAAAAAAALTAGPLHEGEKHGFHFAKNARYDHRRIRR